MRVVFLDEIDDVVAGGSKRDMIGHAPWHSRMQDGDDLAFSVEYGCPRVTFAREVAGLLVKVEDRDLPRLLVKLTAGIGFQLGVATEGEIG